MAFLVILLAVLSAVSAVQQEGYKLPKELVEKAKRAALPCAEENNVDPALMLKFPTGSLPADEPTNRFLYCTLSKIQFITEDGHMVVEKIANVVKDHPLVEEYKAALAKCNEVTKENPLATVLAMHKCVAQAPIVFLL